MSHSPVVVLRPCSNFLTLRYGHFFLGFVPTLLTSVHPSVGSLESLELHLKRGRSLDVSCATLWNYSLRVVGTKVCVCACVFSFTFQRLYVHVHTLGHVPHTRQKKIRKYSLNSLRTTSPFCLNCTWAIRSLNQTKPLCWTVWRPMCPSQVIEGWFICQRTIRP